MQSDWHVRVGIGEVGLEEAASTSHRRRDKCKTAPVAFGIVGFLLHDEYDSTCSSSHSISLAVILRN